MIQLQNITKYIISDFSLLFVIVFWCRDSLCLYFELVTLQDKHRNYGSNMTSSTKYDHQINKHLNSLENT